MSIRTSATLALAAVTMSLGLSACGGGQSVEDACKIANKRATEATQNLSSISPTDPEGSASSIDKINDTLKDTVKDLENEKVKKELSELSDQFSKLTDLLGQLKDAGTDTTKLQQVSGELQSLSTDITQQAQDLNKLCS
ncbi:MAG: hypothetical protein PGN07_00230 [Aeromicrobium erythreum]